MTAILNELFWFRLDVELVNIRKVPSMEAHPLCIMEAIVKATSFSINYPYPVTFHIKNKKHTLRLRYHDRLTLEILFFKCSMEDVLRWKEAFINYLQHPETGKNFDILFISEPQKRTLQQIYSERGTIPSIGELCLEFLTPLHIKRQHNKPRTYLSKSGFANALLKRIQRLFDIALNVSFNNNFEILPYYWTYTEIKHPSHSQKGHIQYINGCAGRLYIKGNFSDLLPYIVLCSEIHAGTKLSNSYGYYMILNDPPPYFDIRLLNKQTVVSVIHDLFDRYDIGDLIQKECKPSSDSELPDLLNPDEFAGKLIEELRTGTYMPKPTTSFRLKKKSGDYRIVEQLSFKDLVVSQLLLKILSEPFDRILEESSIGFRKGKSRQLAIELFKEAVKEGYYYVIESDIEDFFPSVDHEILNLLLDHYIPAKDIVTKQTLKKLLSAGYIESGQYHDRIKGLPQGSPLSPLLANLYLDTFDEQIYTLNLKLIRYGDDFIILTKTKKEAEEILLKTRSFLSDLGLRIKEEKTAIKSVFDGFEFLGIRFEQAEAVFQTGEEIKLFKKPLYITEPYVFLSLSGDTVNIKKDDKIIESFPLRRISEIICMGNAAFSTSFIKRCSEFNIPVTITLGSGYFITTIKPENKNHFDISYLQAEKYYSLSEAMKLEIAREIVKAKIKNYETFLKRKRLPSGHPIFHWLEKALDSLNNITNLNELRGFEGITSRKMFEAVNELIDNQAFHIKTRRRDKPDRINTLLNLAHYLIFSRTNATLRASGMNPYLGFLHDPANRYESLAADLQEPFRPRIEHFLVKIINMRIIKEEDFTESDRGLYLKKDAIRTFLNHFEAELEKKPKKETPSLKDHLYYQVLNLKEFLLHDRTLSFYRWED